MRLEVIVESEEPKIFPLNQSEILIGSGDICDIILDADGISRKHVKILVIGDNFYVVDQGSTNGTYINEERLIPGRKTDFTSYFPVRLGDKVFLTLLSDEEAADSDLSSFAKKIEEHERTLNFDTSDSTKAFSVNELNRTPKTLELQQAKKTRSTAVKNKSISTHSKTKKSNLGLPLLFIIILVGGGIYYKIFDREVGSIEVAKKARPVVEDKQLIEQPQVKEPPKIEWKISEEELLPKSKMEIYLNDLKCFNPEEKFFCDLMPNKSEKDGVIQVGESFVFLVEQKKLIEAAKQLLQIEVQQQLGGEVQVFSLELYKVGMILAMRALLTLKNTENYKDMNFYIAIYDENGSENIIKYVAAIKRSALEQFVPFLDDFNINRIKQFGSRAIKDSEIYYSFY